MVETLRVACAISAALRQVPILDDDEALIRNAKLTRSQHVLSAGTPMY
jgi:hypothetical protein